MSKEMSKGNPNSSAGSPGPSGSRQGGDVKKYLKPKSIKQKSGNKSQSS